MRKLILVLAMLLLSLPASARMYSIGEVCTYMTSSQINPVSATLEDRYNAFLYNYQCRVADAANVGNFKDAAWISSIMLDEFYLYENSTEIWSRSPFRTQKAAINAVVMNYMFSKVFELATDPQQVNRYIGGVPSNRFQMLNAARGMESVFQYTNRLTQFNPPAELLYTNACKQYLPRYRRTGKINNQSTFKFVEAFILKVLADEVKCPQDYVGVVKEYLHYLYFLHFPDNEITKMVERRTLELDEDCDSNRFGTKQSKACYAAAAELRDLISK